MKPFDARPASARRAAVALGMALCAAGCAPFHATGRRTAQRAEPPLGGVPTQAAAWPDDAWWRAFGDPALDALIERARAGAPALDVVRARFESAAREVEAARAEARPQLDLGAAVARSHLDAPAPAPAGGDAAGGPGGGGAAGGGTATMLPTYDTSALAGAALRYQFDWWGRRRAGVQAALDAARASEAERHAAEWLLVYAVASTYYDWTTAHARIELAGRMVALDERRLAIARLRVERGLDGPQTVDAVRGDLASARRSLESLRSGARTDLAEIAALLGCAVTELAPMQARPLPHPDTAVPDDATLALAARRPDLVASRWRVEAAARQVDAARAAFYPEIGLNALAAVVRAYPTPGSPGTARLYDAGLSAYLPLLDGGRLQAQYDIRQAALDAAVAEYNQSLVGAALDVARQTVSLDGLRAQQAQQAEALAAGEGALGVARTRERSGVDDPRSTLSAESDLLRTRDAAVQLDGNLLAAQLGLIRALGGGYRDRPRGEPVARR